MGAFKEIEREEIHKLDTDKQPETCETTKELDGRDAPWRTELRKAMKPKERMAIPRVKMNELDAEYRSHSRKEEVISAEDVQEELMSKLKASDYVDYEDELAVKFQEAILTLPEKQRIVFNLRYYDELEYEDIARVLDSKVETLKVNYHYAKDKIKEYILNR